MPGPTGNSIGGHDDVEDNDGDAANAEQSTFSRLDDLSVRSSCQLFLIFHDIAKHYLGTDSQGDVNRGAGSSRPRPLDVGVAETYYKRLLGWATGLPLGLVRGDHNSHQVTMLQ